MKKSVDEIRELFYDLSYKKQVAILWEALDMMNQYNGRSKWKCVALAMGLEMEED